MGFVCSLICLFGWGLADIFYKKSSDEKDKYSHLKISIWVGLVMGVCAIVLLPFSESSFSGTSLLINAIKYFPASLCYIISMVIGYAGLRYLEISIVSPVQNSSGGLAAVAMIIWFTVCGKFSNIGEEFGAIDIVGTVFCVLGVVLLAVVENKLEKSHMTETENKLSHSAYALIFPILYCLFDTIGTAADGIILDEETGLGLGEIDVIVLYGLTFLVMGVVSWLFLLIKEKKAYNPFTKSEIKTKGVAALFEEFGQVFYVFAMANNPVLAAPVVASYCIVSVVLSRIFLKEKLTKNQYLCVLMCVIGIVILGISEGLAEL